MPDPNVQTVQLASKGIYETIVEMLVKQGPIAILLAVAVWFLWSAGQKAEERHAAELIAVRAEAKSEMDRLERVLGGRQDVIEAKATSAEVKAAVVEQQVITAEKKADKVAAKVEKIQQGMPTP